MGGSDWARRRGLSAASDEIEARVEAKRRRVSLVFEFMVRKKSHINSGGHQEETIPVPLNVFAAEFSQTAGFLTFGDSFRLISLLE